MSDATELRARIRSCQEAHSRAAGEIEALEGEVDRERGKLQELLGCEPGGEAAAVKRLRAKIERDEATVSLLLDEAEAAQEVGE